MWVWTVVGILVVVLLVVVIIKLSKRYSALGTATKETV
jgi:hypothetical protein